MPTLTCNACNSEFEDESQQKLHYKSEWHRYNLKRKVAGVPGVTEALFLARQSALAQEEKKLNEAPMLYSCALCGKEYRSSKAHEQHLKSRSHIMRASQGTFGPQNLGVTVIKPMPSQILHKNAPQKGVVEEESDDSEDEWEEVGSDEDLVGETAESLTNLNVDDDGSDEDMDTDEEVDPSCCFMCDLKHKTIESCMVHMHKHHGFFIPDVEYLKDPKGLLTYLGLKVRRDFMCLYCNDKCQPFSSLEGVRKHMAAKSHCKVRYGDGGDDEEAELEDFYDYSSRRSSQQRRTWEWGAELVITTKHENGSSIKTLGSREFLRYYRQKPRPSPSKDIPLAVALASRYRSMGLTTVQSKEQIVRMKVLKEINRRGVDAMRSRIGMKSNVIRNLPKNVPY
ncbi:hypothetical protein Scep_023262 [Stephania cephalantha]|uniref:C2H2-type domain-containing protein n=1 Tax=Stephania cephalantha TaxID=152367 RepID=A0AAP0EX89_9MAGN